MVDWHAVLRSQAETLRLPRFVQPIAERLLRTPVLHRLAGLDRPVDVRELDMVTRADELDVPILLTLDGQNWWDYRPDLWPSPVLVRPRVGCRA